MKIQFLGTAASPSTPLPFCQCDACRNARVHKGKNFRRRSSLIINEDLLIDIGPDIISSSFYHNIPLSGIRICLQTHFHEDHFDPEILMSRHNEYGSINIDEISILASKGTIRYMDSIINRRCDYGSIINCATQKSLGIKVNIVNQFERIKVGRYYVTGLPANHGLPEHGCLIYIIEDNEKCILYATDTSIIHESVWEYLRHKKIFFDLIILDCTYGIGYQSRQGDHLAVKDFVLHIKRFKSESLVNETTKIYATHLSHEGILEHEIFDHYAMENGFRIAYDGLQLDL